MHQPAALVVHRLQLLEAVLPAEQLVEALLNVDKEVRVGLGCEPQPRRVEEASADARGSSTHTSSASCMLKKLMMMMMMLMR